MKQIPNRRWRIQHLDGGHDRHRFPLSRVRRSDHLLDLVNDHLLLLLHLLLHLLPLLIRLMLIALFFRVS